MWDSDAWRVKNSVGRAKRAVVTSTHHQGSTTVAGYAAKYVSVLFLTCFLCMLNHAE